MEAILIKSRYKVTYVQYAEENYAALLAVDIESRDKDEYLLNVYDGELIKEYVGCYDRLKRCPQYKGMFMADGALVAAFVSGTGAPIDEVFFKGAKLTWQKRMEFAQLIAHLALSTSDYPPALSCAMLLSENLLVRIKDNRLEVNCRLRPLANMNPREAAYLASDQLKKVLLRRFASPDAEIAFLEGLDERVFLTPTALYSYWCDNRELIRADYEMIDAKASLQRVLYLLFKNILRLFKKVFKRGKKQKAAKANKDEKGGVEA